MRLITYPGFLENKKVLVSGRLIYVNLKKIKKDDSRIKNILNMVKQYFSIGIPNAKIKIEYDNTVKITKTNKYGSFKTYFDYKSRSAKTYIATYKGEKRSSKIFLPENKKIAIISDVDDTFLVTHSTTIFKRMWTSATNNYATRSSVKDIIDIYKNFSGPIFYVSDSQWRLYYTLEGFRKINDMPPGPFLLKGKSKHIRIKSIFNSYPYKFILIGDDGKKDPEEYSKLQKEFPEKIKAICIRHISTKKRFEEVEKMLPKSKSLISSDGNKCLQFVKTKIKD